MSLVIINSDRNDDPVHYQNYFQNEIIIPKNAEIGLYSSVINVRPDMIINENNELLAVMFDYKYTGGKLDLYEDKTNFETKRYEPITIKLVHGVYSPLEFSNMLYQVLTYYDCCALNGYEITVEEDAGNQFSGYKIKITTEHQTAQLTDMETMDSTQLGTGECTITSPSQTDKVYQKTFESDDEKWDTKYQLHGAINRHQGQIIFQPKEHAVSYIFGLTRNLIDKGFVNLINLYQKNYILTSNDAKLDEANNEIYNYLGEEVGNFFDWCVFIDEGVVKLFYLFTDEDSDSGLKEYKYWTKGITGLDAQITLTSDNPLFRYTLINEGVKLELSVDGGTVYQLMNNMYEWKGITSATMLLYPCIMLHRVESEISIISTQEGAVNLGFVEPTGDSNASNQAMSNAKSGSLVSEYTSANYIKLALFNKDFNCGLGREQQIVNLERDRCKVIENQTDDTDINLIDTGETYFTAGSSCNTTEFDYYPYLITQSVVHTLEDAIQDEKDNLNYVIINWDYLNNTQFLLNIGNLLTEYQWNLTDNTYETGTDRKISNVNYRNIYVRLDNLPIQTFNGRNHSLSRIVGVVPRFSEFDHEFDSGHLYKVHNPVLYVKLNNPETLRLNQIEISLVDDKEKLAKNLTGQTQLTFHIK